MNSNFSLIPLTCENHGEPPLFLSKCPPRDVVEPPAPAGAGLHPHEFDQGPGEYRGNQPPFDDAQFNGGRTDDERPSTDDEHPSTDDAHGDQEHGDQEHREDERSQRRALQQSDKFDREVSRARAQRERLERRARGKSQSRVSDRRRATAGTGFVDPHDEREGAESARVQDAERNHRHARHHQEQPELPTRNHLNRSRGVANVATYSDSVKRFSTGPLHGTALALYFVLLPYVVVTKWALTQHEANGTLIRVLLVALGIFWLAFLFQVGHNIIRLRKGDGLASGGTAWLAGLVVAVLPFLIPASASAAPPSLHTQPAVSAKASDSPWLRQGYGVTPKNSKTPNHHAAPAPVPLSTFGAVPMALMAKRRHDLLRQQQFDHSDDQIDDVIELLRAYNPALVARIRFLIGIERCGVVHVPSDIEHGELSHDTDPLEACALAQDDKGLFVAFSREGGQLAIEASWSSDDVTASMVAMHEGRLVFAANETELLRALATRVLRNTMVVYLGAAHDLDDELRACCVTLSPIIRADPVAQFDFSRVSAHPDAPTITPTGDVRVELLRADPQVNGLSEPFTPTLRRRCIEMVAYLALHRGEPVTGDRLRSRVLSHADVEASNRTLANTASAVRRSLGVNAKGPRLHPVTSSGLYATHGVTSDVETFHTLVSRARGLSVGEAAPLVHEALQLVHGEPLASALRGFEWFLAEGHNASLQRDGEWAALVLHHDAMSQENYELAFWSLQQGLLVDPYSDVLLEALARVPRLRQFGGDRTSGSKDETVGSGGAVVVGWSFNGLGNQISQ